MRKLRIGLLLAGLSLTLAVVGITAPAPAGGATAPAAPVRPVDDPRHGLVHQGLSRNEIACSRGYAVTGRRAEVLGCTHGPDPAPAHVDVRVERGAAALAGAAAALPAPTPGPTTNANGIPCIGDGTTGYRVEVIYAVPSNRTNRYATVAALIRSSYAPYVEWQYERSAAETGAAARVQWVTTANGTSCDLVVRQEVLTSAADDSFANTISELKARGYTRTDRRYMVLMDATVLCGIGEIYRDSQPGPSNLNNGGRPVFGRSDSGCWGYAEGHELMHNLGGVQPGAPHGTPNFHCYDEADEMCYDDDGSGPVVMQTRCAGRDGRLFDCNHDDYFYGGTPPTSSWLSTHWNTYNSRFLNREVVAPPPPPPPPPTNVAPTVDAGPAHTVELPAGAALDGTVTDDGLPTALVTTTWATVSGPGPVTFADPAAVDTAATFTVAGTYTLSLTANDGALAATDTTTVTVGDPVEPPPPPPPTNVAPSVDAGPARTVVLPAAAALDGTVTDDGLPSGAVTTAWTKASGPGTVTFADAAAVDTTATFSAAGSYSLRLTAGDGALSASDTVSVTVGPATTTSTVSGSFTSSRRSVTHNFSGKPGTITVSFSVSSTSGRSVTATVRSPGGSSLGTRTITSGSTTFSVTGTSTGTYRLVMTGTRGSYTGSVTRPA